MKLLIDWSVICHICWHKMNSKNYIAKTDTEQTEFARNITLAIYYFVLRFRPKQLIFALDSPDAKYWRHDVYEKYYRKHTKVFAENTVIEGNRTTIYYLNYDHKFLSLVYNSAAEKYIQNRVLKKEKEAFLEAVADVHNKDAYQVPQDEIIQELYKHYPSYKGNRKDSSWPYATPKAEFKELCSNIAKHLAHTFGARLVQVDGAEADDVAYMYQDTYPNDKILMITTDQDWHQLGAKNKNITFWNPMQTDWDDFETDQARFKLAVKIMSGDSSDNIAGTWPVTNTRPVSKKLAEGTITKQGLDKIYGYMKQHFDAASYKRNLKLIYFGNTPKAIKKAINANITGPKPKYPGDKYSLSDYAVDAQDKLLIQSQAKEARESDIEEGRHV